MKRVGYITDKDGRRITLLEAMGDYGNVQKAYNKARKCKRHRKDVLIFTKDKEENLDKVREDIINLAYEPSKYHYFKVYEPKERQIMALPFYDRVVQHAINNVLEPIFDKRFISQSYACRKGKGMHAASDTLKEWLYEWNKYHPDQPLYAIKADIHHYFQSIDHAVLKTEIRKVIKDAGVLALLDRIIDHNGNMPDGVGIPVGNLTSQLFANIYLDALDQFIKHELGVEAYIRYMDDFVILSPDKEQLRSWLARIEQFLREELKLEFNPKTTILAAKNGIDFVGYKHRATNRKVRKDSIKRIKRTIKKSWTDEASQLGAFTSLENAKSACKAGYTVYDDNGKAVYTAAGQQASAGVPFSVQVDILDLNIRTGAGTNYAKTGETTGKGVFTIVEVKAGQGASVGWGRLKSGAGWISLDYATRLA